MAIFDKEAKFEDLLNESTNEFVNQNLNVYQSNGPFPHIVIDNFLDPEIAKQLSRAFDSTKFVSIRHFNEDKSNGRTS